MTFHSLVLILHVLGACLFVGMAMLCAILSFGTWTPEKIGHLRFIGSFGMWASLWQLVTGILLATDHWDELRGSKLFWIKMTLYVLEGAIFSRLIGKQAAKVANGSGRGLSLALQLNALTLILIASIGVAIVEF